jgi:hypothetical protein
MSIDLIEYFICLYHDKHLINARRYTNKTVKTNRFNKMKRGSQNWQVEYHEIIYGMCGCCK